MVRRCRESTLKWDLYKLFSLFLFVLCSIRRTFCCLNFLVLVSKKSFCIKKCLCASFHASSAMSHPTNFPSKHPKSHSRVNLILLTDQPTDSIRNLSFSLNLAAFFTLLFSSEFDLCVACVQNGNSKSNERRRIGVLIAATAINFESESQTLSAWLALNMVWFFSLCIFVINNDSEHEKCCREWSWDYSI